ncbi:glycosyltransferase family 4 protein [Agromyces mediolanus]|uniref:glycosyltransferase family 4 protein n=1 Tax=Agromyces mediolanus TaxID=41986 RepID=UPI00383459C2
MRVLVVTTWLPTESAPESGIFVKRDIELLALDHDVDVVHLSATGGTLSFAGPRSITTIRMSPTNPGSVAAARRELRTRLRDTQLVHSMAASALLPFRGLEVPIPWVHTEHWSGLVAPRTVPLAARIVIPAIDRLLARPDAVVTVGARLADRVQRVRRRPTMVIPNAVTMADTAPARRVGPGIRLLGVGGLLAAKGPELAVGAVAELLARGHDVRLDWLGEGPMRSELEHRSIELGVADRVVLHGRVEPDHVGAALAESDVFILPTQSETFGVAIAEALAAGRPVVVGSNGEQAGFVAPPDGVLVAERTPDVYADGVEAVLAANIDRSAEQIASAARARFTESARRSAYADVYAGAGEARRARS